MSAIAELFDRDPLKLSDRDLDEIVAYMRANRENFNKAQERVTKTAKAKQMKTDVEVAVQL